MAEKKSKNRDLKGRQMKPVDQEASYGKGVKGFFFFFWKSLLTARSTFSINSLIYIVSYIYVYLSYAYFFKNKNGNLLGSVDPWPTT